MQRLSDYLKSRFGEKIYRLSLSSGCTCPNRDGTLMTGGCTFCSAGGSGEFAAGIPSGFAACAGPADPADPAVPSPSPPACPDALEEQIRQAKERIAAKTDARRFIAYFQSYSNTYGDPGRLRALYTAAIKREDIVVLSLGTRPDCLPPAIMEMLKDLNAIKPVWVELGLQTANDRTAEMLHRGYPLRVFDEACRKLAEAGIGVIVHIILGLPGETREDMLKTVRHIASLTPPPQGIKIQMLQVLKGSLLGDEYIRSPFPLLTLEEYTELVAECVKILPPGMVLHRMTGDGPRALLIAPLWSLNKKKVLNTLNHRIFENAGGDGSH